jgi:hypothetical protein
MVPSAAGNSCVECAAGMFQPTRGSTKCLPCGQGLSSVPGSAFCSSFMNVINYALDPSLPHSTTCRFHSWYGTYDTRPLAKLAAAQQRLGVVDNSTMQYYFSVCPEIFNSSHFRGSCVGKNGRHVDAPSCQVTTSHFAYAIGRYPSFTPRATAALPSRCGTATHPQPAPRATPPSTSCATPGPTSARLPPPTAWPSTSPACTPSSGAARTFFPAAARTVQCNAARSYACPICTLHDVAFDRDVCVGGNRSVTAYWQPESRQALASAFLLSSCVLSF